jgi:hypothetical protein
VAQRGPPDCGDAFRKLAVVALGFLAFSQLGGVIVAVGFELPEKDAELVLGNPDGGKRPPLCISGHCKQVDAAGGEVKAFEGKLEVGVALEGEGKVGDLVKTVANGYALTGVCGRLRVLLDEAGRMLGTVALRRGELGPSAPLR